MPARRLFITSTDTAKQTESVEVAARRMLDRNVGSLVVVDDHQQPIGILTDRDLTVRVLAFGKDPSTTVAEVMTCEPHVVREDTEVEDVLRVMRWGPFRRVPVVNDKGRLVGVISLDDVLNLIGEEFGSISRLLHKEDPRVLASTLVPANVT